LGIVSPSNMERLFLPWPRRRSTCICVVGSGQLTIQSTQREPLYVPVPVDAGRLRGERLDDTRIKDMTNLLDLSVAALLGHVACTLCEHGVSRTQKKRARTTTATTTHIRRFACRLV
jgi:hypothetical protein